MRNNHTIPRMKTAEQSAARTVKHPRVGKARNKQCAGAAQSKSPRAIEVGNGQIFTGDALRVLPGLEANTAQVIITDPPYYPVLDEAWDNEWHTPKDNLQGARQWVRA